MESINILSIDNLAYDTFNIGEFIQMRSEMDIKLQFKTHDNIIFLEKVIKLEGRGNDIHEALKRMFQSFLDGHFYPETNIYDVRTSCKLSKKIHHIDMSCLSKDMQDLVKQIFDFSNWDFHKMIEA
jgi:hypothetical protein